MVVNTTWFIAALVVLGSSNDHLVSCSELFIAVILVANRRFLFLDELVTSMVLNLIPLRNVFSI